MILSNDDSGFTFMVPSNDALIIVLNVIIEANEERGEWINLWEIRCRSNYSLEYVRHAVKSLYFQHFALNRMKKGAAFFYRPSARAAGVVDKLQKARGKRR